MSKETQTENSVTFDQKQEKTWAMSSHLAAFAGFIGIPFANIFGPLIIWLMKKDSSQMIDAHGKESLNFQISMTIYTIFAAIMCIVIVGFVLLPLILLVNVIFVIKATIKASEGEFYQYPMTIRFIQ
jgi:uncharacterized protein